jgi:hypothetical protein
MLFDGMRRPSLTSSSLAALLLLLVLNGLLTKGVLPGIANDHHSRKGFSKVMLNIVGILDWLRQWEE